MRRTAPRLSSACGTRCQVHLKMKHAPYNMLAAHNATHSVRRTARNTYNECSNVRGRGTRDAINSAAYCRGAVCNGRTESPRSRIPSHRVRLLPYNLIRRKAVPSCSFTATCNDWLNASKHLQHAAQLNAPKALAAATMIAQPLYAARCHGRQQCSASDGQGR
jgi:hypothetical protein